MSRNLLKKNPYKFDKMGYATPRLYDKAVMAVLRIVTKQTPVITKVRPIGEEYHCHDNATKFAALFGGKAVRGYRVELSASGFLEVVDHSVIHAGNEWVDVTPYHGTKASMFVLMDRELPVISETYILPTMANLGPQYTRTLPNFSIPLTREGQATLDKCMGSISARVEESRLWDEGVLNRAHIIVVRF